MSNLADQPGIVPEVLSINEACEAVGICRAAFYAAMKRGEIKVRKLGRRSIVFKSDIRDWLNNLPLYEPVDSPLHQAGEQKQNQPRRRRG